MKLEIDELQIRQFIRVNGVDIYELCPCGSGKKYKWCCKAAPLECKTQNDLKQIYHNLKNEVWNRRKWKIQKCHWAGCTNDTQRCHSIQNNRFLNQIFDVNKNVYHFIPIGTLENESVELKGETVSLASTFNGFCNIHDRELFEVIEANNLMTFSQEQQYALAYRNFYYMLTKKEVTQQIITKTSLRGAPCYYQKDFVPHSSDQAQTAVDLILDLRKNQILYQELSEIIADIETNYETTKHIWQIRNQVLICNSIRTLRVRNPHFCFQTVREYLCKDEIDQLYSNSTISSFQDKRYNQISTIVLPDIPTSQITVFFAISCRHSTQSPLDFLRRVNQCSDQELVDILNNIVVDAYEELYLSKENFFNKFTPDEQSIIQGLFTQRTYESNSVTLIDDILSKPKFDLIRLQAQ
ncbi:SEC-C domain-containing protein [Anaerocolumna chitinilytica]|uniref:SEC-C domain-containing protein n=1 Tax=Anaerocolumna chitinilytica TaxID=1727145 RepID=A0A7I8DJ46_9FIRM|nr:SEC-C domain-containing protein [Anaerocolumna chitinilytica]BCJ98459.1 hypothetical protein bsdcttw_15000 [Anaerocolumna chitinilytica]